MRLPLALAAVLLAAGCVAPAAEEPPAGDGGGTPPPPQLTGTRLLLLGDPGTGEEGQKRVAAAALAVCAARTCDAAVVMGDNIYETGVSSPTDPQFESKFEEPYRAFSIPFYLVLGNHDNGGGGLGTEPAVGDHQVAYSKRTDRSSDKWNMPARYYDVRLGEVHLFGLDSTAVFFGGYPYDPLFRAQEAWLAAGLAASDATWKVVFSHHPYLSNGVHGNAGTEDGIPGPGAPLKLFYERTVCGAADLVLGGHDHDLQWLKENPSCPGVEHILSGAAGKHRPLADPGRNPAHFQVGDMLGFAWAHFDGPSLTVAFYDADAKLLYEGNSTRLR